MLVGKSAFFSLSRALEIENYEEREENKGQETCFPLKNFLQKSENTEMWVHRRKGQGGMDMNEERKKSTETNNSEIKKINQHGLGII